MHVPVGGTGGNTPNEKLCIALPPKESLAWRFTKQNIAFALPKFLYRLALPHRVCPPVTWLIKNLLVEEILIREHMLLIG